MMKRLNWFLVALALMIGGSAVAQIYIPGGPIKPPVPAVKQRQKSKKKERPKKTTTQKVKYYDVTFSCNAYDADLYIDGEYVGDANTTWTLTAGSHTVKVVTDYYNDYSTTINVGSSNKYFDLTLTERTDAESQFQLGINYYEGRSGFPQDQTQAAKRYKKAAEQGHAQAQNWLGYCYHHGFGVTQSYDEAVEWYQKAAKQGNADAQNNLGDCYYYGQGASHNKSEAFNWYKKAAEQGHANAQHNLGMCYKFGQGVTQDWTEAVKWYREAAEQGLAIAQYDLGCCYDNGHGVWMDNETAAFWYQKAADQGIEEAREALERLKRISSFGLKRTF